MMKKVSCSFHSSSVVNYYQNNNNKKKTTLECEGNQDKCGNMCANTVKNEV